MREHGARFGIIVTQTTPSDFQEPWITKENNTILEAAENAVLLAGKGNIKIHKSNQDVNPYTRFDLNFNLANKTFRYEPAISLIDGMKLMKNKVFSKC